MTDLYHDFVSPGLHLDKAAFVQVIHDWPDGARAELRRIIKARFGDESFTTPSVKEALNGMRGWPLDAVTRSLLMDIGNAADAPQEILQPKLCELRRYYFFLMAAAPDTRFDCLRELPPACGAALVRGLALAESHGYSRMRGSVSLVNWAFRAFQSHPLPLWAALADWIVTHTENPYIPFNFVRTRYQWAACREGSPSHEETWWRVCRAEASRQSEKEARIEREKQDSAARPIARQAAHRAREQQRARRSSERNATCTEMDAMPAVQRLERICGDHAHPVTFYPDRFALVEDATLGEMPPPLRAALIDRLKERRGGKWKELRQRLLAAVEN